MEAGKPGLRVSEFTHYVGEDVMWGHNYWDIWLEHLNSKLSYLPRQHHVI